MSTKTCPFIVGDIVTYSEEHKSRVANLSYKATYRVDMEGHKEVLKINHTTDQGSLILQDLKEGRHVHDCKMLYYIWGDQGYCIWKKVEESNKEDTEIIL